MGCKITRNWKTNNSYFSLFRQTEISWLKIKILLLLPNCRSLITSFHFLNHKISKNKTVHYAWSSPSIFSRYVKARYIKNTLKRIANKPDHILLFRVCVCHVLYGIPPSTRRLRFMAILWPPWSILNSPIDMCLVRLGILSGSPGGICHFMHNICHLDCLIYGTP